MSKYYLKHVNASGFSVFRRVNALSALIWIMNLYSGESITIIKRGGYLETKLSEQPNLYEEQ